MKSLKPIWKMSVTCITALCVLSACKSSTKDKIVDGLEKNNEATVSFVNAVDERAYFYIKARALNRDIFDNKNEVLDILPNNAGTYTYKFSGLTERTRIGVRDSTTQTRSATVDIDMDNRDKYWLVAWLNGNTYRLTGLKKRNADQAGVFKIRLFANTAMDVRLNGSNTVVARTEVGQISGYFTVDNCTTGLKLDDRFINICNDAVFGRSYIAVINDGYKAVVAQE